MAKVYVFEPSAAALLVMRVAAQRIASYADGARLTEIAEAAHKRSNELGSRARRLLRQEGFERDCEIDMDMELLAIKAQDAVEALGAYIATNSPSVADFLEKHGDSSLRRWQDSNPSPIRPVRNG